MELMPCCPSIISLLRGFWRLTSPYGVVARRTSTMRCLRIDTATASAGRVHLARSTATNLVAHSRGEKLSSLWCEGSSGLAVPCAGAGKVIPSAGGSYKHVRCDCTVLHGCLPPRNLPTPRIRHCRLPSLPDRGTEQRVRSFFGASFYSVTSFNGAVAGRPVCGPGLLRMRRGGGLLQCFGHDVGCLLRSARRAKAAALVENIPVVGVAGA
jgi:hypothetical protein